MGSSDTRSRILLAAEDVVLCEGVGRLTLEAAATRAQLSKGGVLYHFPTRDALVSAMVERLTDSFDRDLRRFPEPGQRAGKFTRSYVAATFHPAPGDKGGGAAGKGQGGPAPVWREPPERQAPARDEGDGDERQARLGAALLAGLAADPHLLQPLRSRFGAWQSALAEDGIDPALATLVRLAADGLWLADLLGLAPPGPALREGVEGLLVGLTQAASDVLQEGMASGAGDGGCS